MTAPEMFYSLILVILGATIAILISNNRRDALALLLFFFASFGLRWAFVYLNNVLDFFNQKAASDLPMEVLDQPGGIWQAIFGTQTTLGGTKFFIEALINLPGLRLFEESEVMLLITNSFIGAAAGLVTYFYLKRIFDERVATVGLLLNAIYPAAIAFSFFALRDIILYFLIGLNLLSFMWLALKRTSIMLNLFIYLSSFIAVGLLRIAFVPFEAVLPGWLIFVASLRLLNRFRDKNEKMFIAAVLAILLPSLTIGAVLLGYKAVLKQVGYAELVSPDELLVQYAQERYDRGTTAGGTEVAFGGASDELPPSLYHRVGLVGRILVQILGMILIPLPWGLVGITRILAFSDSAFVLFLMTWAWKGNGRIKKWRHDAQPKLTASVTRYPQRTMRIITFALVLAFTLGTIGYGMLVDNSGNAFRMRLTVVPFLIPSASIYVASTYAWAKGKLIILGKRATRLARAAGTA